MDKIKEIFGKIVSWVDTKGFTALASLGIGLGLWTFGYKIYAGIAFGVFLTRNWDILRGLFQKEANTDDNNGGGNTSGTSGIGGVGNTSGTSGIGGVTTSGTGGVTTSGTSGISGISGINGIN